MHDFYKKPKLIQWLVALVLAAIGFIVIGVWMDLCDKTPFGFAAILLLAPIFQFCMAPFFTLIGLYTYISPMLLVFGASAKNYDLHNGTGFDYIFTMRGTASGRPFRNKLLGYYLEGFLHIIQKVEKGELPESVKVQGTSYFFSENTAKRLGFELQKPTSFYSFNLYINFIDLLWMYSLAHGKLTFPNLKDIKLAVTTGGELVKRRAYIDELRGFLQKRS